MTHDRRSVLATLGLALPFVIDPVRASAAPPMGPAPVLGLRSFEEAVREAFAQTSPTITAEESRPCRRIEIGHSEEMLSGIQGCHNDRPFAGFPTGHLRIIRLGSAPGPSIQGVRLYVATVDVVLTGGCESGFPGRPLDFARLPPAPVLLATVEDDKRPVSHRRGNPADQKTNPRSHAGY